MIRIRIGDDFFTLLTRPSRLLISSLILAFSVTSVAQAKVWPVENQWLPIGSTALGYVIGSTEGDDGPNETMLLVDGLTSTGTKGVKYDFRGEMHNGESVILRFVLVNPNVECRLTIDFYNLTDKRVISKTPVIVLEPNSEKVVYAYMRAESRDVNDRLQLRLIRTDDGATSRDFAIDSVLMSNWLFPGTSNNSRVPDLPLLPYDPALQAEMNDIINSWYDDKMPPPSAGAVNSAQQAYSALRISNSGGILTGNINEYSDANFLDKLGAALRTNPANSTWLTMVNNTVKLVAQNLVRGILPVEGRGYDVRHFIRDAVLLKDYLDEDAKDSLNYVLHANTQGFYDYWKADYPGVLSDDTIDTDQIYNYSDTLLMYAIGFQHSPQEAQRWARGFKRYYDRFATPSRGTSNGIKVDGSGYHHWTNHEHYLYCYKTYIDVLEVLDRSQLQIDEDKYYNFRDAVIAHFVRSRETVKALSLSGRNPNSPFIELDNRELKQFALVGGRILGLSTADPEVAAVYNSIYGVDPALGVTDLNPLDGAFQHNYSAMGIYRRDNWTATMRGLSASLWGTEIYPTENRYGRYQSYGGLQVIYSGGAVSNGISTGGWDWNYAPGTTTIVLPFTLLHAERERLDEYQTYGFVGFGTLGNKGSTLLSAVHGEYGVFGMKFRALENEGFGTVYGPNTHDGSFVFHKSAFVFDDIIIALGSDISNDDVEHPTVTTLYQRQADDTQPITVNGTNYTAQGVESFSQGSSRWVLDRLNTGYYVPATNGDLVLSRGLQRSPSTALLDPTQTNSYVPGVFAKLYIDHGTSPSSTDYEFTVIPGATASAMDDFSSAMNGPENSRPYLVKAKDANHHIVKYQGNGKEVWGLALFEDIAGLPADCVVESNIGSSLVMYERHSPGELTLSVTDPNLRLNRRAYNPSPPISVVLNLRGYWVESMTNANVEVQQLDGEDRTQITFSLLDGAPAEIKLMEEGLAVWTEERFDADQIADAEIGGSLADPDGDGIINLFEFIQGKNPMSSDAEGAMSIGYNHPGVEVEFTLAENLSGYAVRVEASDDLKSWHPVLQISNGSAEVFQILDSNYAFEEGVGPRTIKVRANNLNQAGYYRLSADAP